MSSSAYPHLPLLLRNEEFARTLLDNLHAGVVVYRDGKPILLNDKICEILGRPRGELEIVDPLDVVAEPTRTQFKEILQARSRGAAPAGVIEGNILRGDGTLRTVRAEHVPVDCSNERYGVTVMIDVTDRLAAAEAQKRISRELAAAFDLQRMMFDQTFQFMGLLDPKGTVLQVNRTALDLVGRTAGEVVGKRLWEAPSWTHDPRQQDVVQDAVGRAAAGEVVRLTTTRLDVRGALHQIDYSIKPLRDADGRIVNLLTEGRDITDQVGAEQARRESESLYSTLFESAGSAILVVQGERWVRCNERALELFGCTRDQLLGRTPYEFSPPLQEDGSDSRQRVREKIAAALAGHAQVFEWNHIRHDGTLIPTGVALNAVRVREGVVLQAVIHDLTARKSLELQLRQALDELTRMRDLLQQENVTLRQEVRALHGERRLRGASDAIKRVFAQIDMVADTGSTVLVLGETGTGKELVATEIHARSSRRDRPIVRVNCAALPANLIESELFGHDKGAYTGASSRQIGRFELASGSTIFLDEIGEIPPETQVKILRVLQEREIERLGSSRPIKVDVRIIAATNRNLEADVASGRFRADLFYRLNVFPISIPPLRERKGDIPGLVWSFVEELGANMGRRIESISQADMAALVQYEWPGNVRELRNIVERSIIMSNGPQLRLALPSLLAAPTPGSGADLAPEFPASGERERIRAALERCGWRGRGAGGAAESLGLKPTTLETRMGRLGIARPGKGQLNS